MSNINCGSPLKNQPQRKLFSGCYIKEGLFSASGHNIGDGFALEDLHRWMAAAAMVGATLLDFVCVLEI
jgi:hypothetical protein